MNKEHFLIELKIYLKPLPKEQMAGILEKYEAIFTERVAAGETEEQIAKDLGKPRNLAEQLLDEYGIEVPEKKIIRDSWQEFSPQKEPESTYYDYEHPYEPDYEYPRPPRSPLARLWQIIGLVCLNMFLMIWLIFSGLCVLFGVWLTDIVLLVSPFLGVFLLVTNFSDANLFQFFVSIVLFGLGVIGLLILTPITKVFGKVFKNYFMWNIRVLRGER